MTEPSTKWKEEFDKFFYDDDMSAIRCKDNDFMWGSSETDKMKKFIETTISLHDARILKELEGEKKNVYPESPVEFSGLHERQVWNAALDRAIEIVRKGE